MCVCVCVCVLTKPLNAPLGQLLQFSEYCELKYDKTSIDKLKRDLTGKSGGIQKATQLNI